MTLNNYINSFQRLHVSRSQGVAPHKLVLLISVLDEIESGRIIENKICITPELVATFKENWATLVDSKIFTPTFALPFYHLKNDKFWHLVTFPGCEIAVTSSNSIRSFSPLKAAVDCASFDEVLFQYLVQPDKRAMLRIILLDTYFANTKQKYIRAKGNQGRYIASIEMKLLNEPLVEYKREIS